MNQHQRKFLLEQIEKQYKTELAELNEKRPKEPSLNNYLTAAILDGSAKLKSNDEIREAIRKRVRDLGKTESLITHGDSWGRRRTETDTDVISLPASVLFEVPTAFAVVMEEYEVAKEKWDASKKSLEDSINAMRIKVQVGSDKALEALVDQADKLCSMSLTASSRLLLPQHSSES